MLCLMLYLVLYLLLCLVLYRYLMLYLVLYLITVMLYSSGQPGRQDEGAGAADVLRGGQQVQEGHARDCQRTVCQVIHPFYWDCQRTVCQVIQYILFIILISKRSPFVHMCTVELVPYTVCTNAPVSDPRAHARVTCYRTKIPWYPSGGKPPTNLNSNLKIVWFSSI